MDDSKFNVIILKIVAQTYNSSFHEKLASVQYNVCLTLTLALKRNYIKNSVLSSFEFLVGTENIFYKVINNAHP